jgi:hypothetical protein
VGTQAPGNQTTLQSRSPRPARTARHHPMLEAIYASIILAWKNIVIFEKRLSYTRNQVAFLTCEHEGQQRRFLPHPG